MVFVGTFTEEELIAKKDKIETEKLKAETGLEYVLTKVLYMEYNDKKEPYALSVWVCSYEDYMNNINAI